MPDFELNIGNNIRHYRKANQLTQEKLAEKANLSVKFISMLESDPKRNISIQALAKIATALNVPLEALIAEDGTPNTHRPYTKMLLDILTKMPQDLSDEFSLNFLDNIKIFEKHSK